MPIHTAGNILSTAIGNISPTSKPGKEKISTMIASPISHQSPLHMIECTTKNPSSIRYMTTSVRPIFEKNFVLILRKSTT